MNALYDFNLKLSNEYADYLEDVTKLIVTMVCYQIFGNIIQGTSPLLPEGAMHAILYVILGLSVYHLIIKKLFRLHYVNE